MQNNINSIQSINEVSNDTVFNQLSQQFHQINQAFVFVFKDDRVKSNLLSKNQTASLYSQVCNYLSTGSYQQPNEKKKKLIIGFRKWMRQFIQNYLLQQLAQKHSQHQFIKCFIQKWEHFKKFSYFYFFVFKSADSHYELTYKQYKNQGKANVLSSEDSIFPVPAIAINYFKTLVYEKYKSQVNKNIRYLLSQQRENRSIDRQALRSLFEIVYSCGLGQLSRINSVKGSGNQFQFEFSKTINKQVQNYFCNSHNNPDTIFFDNILNCVIEDIEVYYNHLFKDKISQFGPHQDFVAVLSILQKEQQMSEHYLFNHLQKQAYMKKIKEIIVVTNLQERLTRENSLVSLLQKFDHTSDEYIKEIKVFADIIFKSKKQSLKILENVMKTFLIQSGARVNEKLNKRRCNLCSMHQST